MEDNQNNDSRIASLEASVGALCSEIFQIKAELQMQKAASDMLAHRAGGVDVIK